MTRKENELKYLMINADMKTMMMKKNMMMKHTRVKKNMLVKKKMVMDLMTVHLKGLRKRVYEHKIMTQMIQIISFGF
jgi:hypothetical protein